MADRAATTFAGQRRRLFGMALRIGVLSILTLGIYRFWGRSRLRRWYWSAVRPGGDPLEYTGEGSEKFAGFLMAVCVLAFWLGVVNLLLMFVSLSWLATPSLAYVLSLVGLIPVWIYARYRARAYMLARTRWRGVRFAMAPGAGGYTLRACWHGFLTLLTLGYLWPRMTFALEKFRTDRTFFGDQRLHQGGDWSMLQPAFAPVYFGSGMMLAALLLAATSTPRMIWLAVPFGLWAIYGVVHFRVMSRRVMANTKTAGGVGLHATPEPAKVARIVGFGWLAIAIMMGLPVIGMVLVVELTSIDQMLFALAAGEFDPIAIAVVVVATILYFGVFVLFGVLRHCLITLPLWRHYAQSLSITGRSTLIKIGPRDAQAAGDAGGMAEALDIGAAI